MTLALALLMASATTAWADEPKTRQNVWESAGKCLAGEVQTMHGAPNYVDPDVPEDGGHPNGLFANTAESSRDYEAIYVGGTIHCYAKRAKGIDELAVRTIVLKLDLSTGQPAICVVLDWKSNPVPTELWEALIATTAGNPGPCGAGHYKTQGYQREFENSAWVPAKDPCTAKKTTGCIKGMITPAWHWFPVSRCHIDPSLCPPPPN